MQFKWIRWTFNEKYSSKLVNTIFYNKKFCFYFFECFWYALNLKNWKIMILIKVDIYVKQMYVDISLVFELKRIIIEKNKMIILILKTNVYIFLLYNGSTCSCWYAIATWRKHFKNSLRKMQKRAPLCSLLFQVQTLRSEIICGHWSFKPTYMFNTYIIIS